MRRSCADGNETSLDQQLDGGKKWAGDLADKDKQPTVETDKQEDESEEAKAEEVVE